MSCKVVYIEALFNLGYQNTLKSRGVVLSIYEAKTKSVSAKLICDFVFANAKSRFFHNEAKISKLVRTARHYKI